MLQGSTAFYNTQYESYNLEQNMYVIVWYSGELLIVLSGFYIV